MGYFLNTSAKLGANMLDWLRSVYFSLLTSTLLILLTKLYSLDWPNIIVLIFALTCILYGLWQSVQITNRFKIYEKDFDKDPVLEKDLTSEEYFVNRDTLFALQHRLMYLFLIPSLLLIGAGGCLSERQASQSSKKNKEILEEIRIKQQQDFHQDSISAVMIINLEQLVQIKQDSIIHLKKDLKTLNIERVKSRLKKD